jgi:hypothetical protein
MLWRHADRFDPARFLSRSRNAIHRYAYLPFGVGPRGCIGSVFALQEASLAVAAIVRSFELEVAPEHTVWPVHRITLRPRGGLPMMAHERPSAHRSFAVDAAIERRALAEHRRCDTFDRIDIHSKLPVVAKPVAFLERRGRNVSQHGSH